MTTHAGTERSEPRSRIAAWRWIIALIAFLAIAGLLLLTEHRAHVLGVLIYLPLLACPLMHLFMHGGHGGHSDHGHSRTGGTK